MTTTNLVLYLPKCMVKEFDYVIERKFINKNEYVTNALKQQLLFPIFYDNNYEFEGDTLPFPITIPTELAIRLGSFSLVNLLPISRIAEFAFLNIFQFSQICEWEIEQGISTY